MTGYVDILLITESKLDNSFPTAQFQINGFSSPYLLDRNAHGGGGILLYVREDNLPKLLKGTHFEGNLGAMFVEINLRKKKWLLNCSCNGQKSEIRKHLGAVGKNLDSYSSKYENFILFGDFNVEPTDAMEEFMKVYNLENLVKGPTCFKNLEKPCIDLILTNKIKSVQTSYIIETGIGISDFHKMVMTVLKVYFKKKRPSVIQYCNYKNFDNYRFRNDLPNEPIRSKIEISRIDIFVNTVFKVLSKNNPLKNVILEQTKLLS